MKDAHHKRMEEKMLSHIERKICPLPPGVTMPVSRDSTAGFVLNLDFGVDFSMFRPFVYSFPFQRPA